VSHVLYEDLRVLTIIHQCRSTEANGKITPVLQQQQQQKQQLLLLLLLHPFNGLFSRTT